MKHLLLSLTILLFSITVFSEKLPEIKFSSTEQKTTLIELYTSQGCSSCPPAEKWLNGLKEQKGLFKTFVPLAFHVDYWDYIGWKDIYADPVFSKRQRSLRSAGNISSVYTPGFVVSGQEWRKWFEGEAFPDTTVVQTGILAGSIKDDKVSVTYSKKSKNLVLHVALLANGIETHVTQGENTNRILKADFVVVEYAKQKSNQSLWEIPLPAVPADIQAKNFALAVWVTSEKSYKPIQATGVWLGS